MGRQLINLNISPADPNAHILWIESVNAKLKALRDIEAGDSPSIIDQFVLPWYTQV